MRDSVTAPVLISQVEPEYTKEARKAKKSGKVLVNLIVNQRGMPTQVHVLRGVDKGLDKKAVDAVKQYRFKPAMKDDKPVDKALNVEVNFQVF
jgi:protein TonB